MEILVQHAKFDNETGAVLGYNDVALVDATFTTDINEALEYAYRYTNNVMGSWSIKKTTFPTRDGGEMQNGDYNDDVTVLYTRPDGMGQRSTMIGDRMIVDGVTYKCATFGFTKVELETA